LQGGLVFRNVDLYIRFCHAFSNHEERMTKKEERQQENEASKFQDLHHNDGRVHISGTAILQLTNVTSGKSIVVNASGPGTFTADGTKLLPDANAIRRRKV
jgi:hypothetical protein